MRFKYELSMDSETCNKLVMKKNMDRRFVTKLHHKTKMAMTEKQIMVD